MSESDAVRVMLDAYSKGFFPMGDPDEPMALGWYNPDPRGVIPLEAFHVSRNLARRVRSGRFDIRCDTAFGAVMEGCAGPRTSDEGTWISEGIHVLYRMLHRAGHAHSIEAWFEGHLVGGLYGVSLGGLFAGESMFSRRDLGGTDASKVCLVHLVSHLVTRGYVLLDVQMWNPHLEQFGCVEWPRARYLEALGSAVEADVSWGSFDASLASGRSQPDPHSGHRGA